MNNSHNACSAATEDDFQALREVEEAWLASELGRAISNLAYPVGCGAAPTDYHLKAAARALFDRYAKMVKMARGVSDAAQSVGMRGALEDTANWLEGCLNCKTWSWDGLQRDAAEKALEGARAILASQPSPAATVETKSAPPPLSSLPSGESGPPVMATVGGADTQCSAVIGGVYGAKSLPPGASIATANKAIEFLEWLSGYIGHGPAVQISSDQMEYIRSKVHPLVRELGATDPAAIDCPCNADCSAMPNGPLYNCPYLPENQPRTLNEPQAVKVNRVEIAMMIDPDAFIDAMLQDDLTPTERLHFDAKRMGDKLAALKKADDILAALALSRPMSQCADATSQHPSQEPR